MKSFLNFHYKLSIQVTQAQTKGQFKGQGEVERNDISQNSSAMAKPY
jgi:hypothetical protein